MPIRDTAARTRSLDNDYGPTAGPQAPSSHLLALYVGDPMTTGVEVTGPGYERVEVPPAAWLPAADGMKLTDGPVFFPAPTGEWEDAVTHFLLLDGDDPTVGWDSAPLAEPLVVTGPGTPIEVVVAVFYDDSVDPYTT